VRARAVQIVYFTDKEDEVEGRIAKIKGLMLRRNS
jgi:hypothetical protein